MARSDATYRAMPDFVITNDLSSAFGWRRDDSNVRRLETSLCCAACIGNLAL